MVRTRSTHRPAAKPKLRTLLVGLCLVAIAFASAQCSSTQEGTVAGDSGADVSLHCFELGTGPGGCRCSPAAAPIPGYSGYAVSECDVNCAARTICCADPGFPASACKCAQIGCAVSVLPYSGVTVCRCGSVDAKNIPYGSKDTSCQASSYAVCCSGGPGSCYCTTSARCQPSETTVPSCDVSRASQCGNGTTGVPSCSAPSAMSDGGLGAGVGCTGSGGGGGGGGVVDPFACQNSDDCKGSCYGDTVVCCPTCDRGHCGETCCDSNGCY